jgi:DNA-binding winged helix-turn-helix (wHTH) protein/Tol biopolymer transport system component
MTELPMHSTRLDDLLIDWGRLVIVRRNATVKLTPKAAAVLQILLSQPNVTVTRQALLDAVWPGTASSDEVLTQVIAELRRAFEDPAKDAHHIATVPKLGYRWIGSVPRSDVRQPTMLAEMADADAPSPQDAAARITDAAGMRPRRWLPFVALAALVAILIALVFERARPTAPPAPSNAAAEPVPVTLPLPRPVATEPGQDLDPAISPDGRRVAYVHSSDARARLRLRTLDALDYEDVELDGEGRPSSPAWSPDGRQIAYLWLTADRCELRRIELASRAGRTIADGCPTLMHSTIDWSPDGAFLVYSRADLQGQALGGRSVSIHRVAPDGSEAARISNSHRWLVVDAHPRVSADAREVAFVRDSDGQRHVIVLSSDGTGSEREVPFQRWAYRVAWRGGGLMVAAHGTTPAEIWNVDADGSHPTLLAAPAAGPGLAVARDGTFAVFEQRVVDDNVWSLDLDRPDAAPAQVTRATRSELCPRISPDGTTLAYLADDGGTLEVTLSTLASGERRRISHFAPQSPVDLRWSPTGRYLAVIVGTASGKHLALLSMDGSMLTVPQSVAAWRIQTVEWTHDETHLLVAVEAGGRRELHRLSFPAITGDELVIDRSIGAFASAFDAPVIYASDAHDNVLQRLDANFEATPLKAVHLTAVPSDQWLVRNGILAQMIQIDRGASAILRYGVLDSGDAVERRIAAPEPPLGRNFDLGAGKLWYSSRDFDNVDLALLPLPAR